MLSAASLLNALILLALVIVTAQASAAARPLCSTWCNVYTCGMPSCSSCTDCAALSEHEYCAGWCNSYTGSVAYCKGCSGSCAPPPPPSTEYLFNFVGQLKYTADGRLVFSNITNLFAWTSRPQRVIKPINVLQLQFSIAKMQDDGPPPNAVVTFTDSINGAAIAVELELTSISSDGVWSIDTPYRYGYITPAGGVENDLVPPPSTLGDCESCPVAVTIDSAPASSVLDCSIFTVCQDLGFVKTKKCLCDFDCDTAVTSRGDECTKDCQSTKKNFCS